MHRNGRQADKSGQWHSSIGRPVWSVAMTEKKQQQKQKQKDSIGAGNAIVCAASYRPTTSGLWLVV